MHDRQRQNPASGRIAAVLRHDRGNTRTRRRLGQRQKNRPLERVRCLPDIGRNSKARLGSGYRRHPGCHRDSGRLRRGLHCNRQPGLRRRARRLYLANRRWLTPAAPADIVPADPARQLHQCNASIAAARPGGSRNTWRREYADRTGYRVRLSVTDRGNTAQQFGNSRHFGLFEQLCRCRFRGSAAPAGLLSQQKELPLHSLCVSLPLPL